MNARIGTQLAALACSALITAQVGAEAVDLRLKLDQGQEFTYDYTIDATEDIEILGVDRNLDVEQESRIRIRCTEVTPEGATVELIYERIKVDIKSPDLTASHDSALKRLPDPDNPLVPIITPMLNKPVILQLAADGQINSVSGTSDMAPEGFAGVVFEKLFGERAIQTMFGPLFHIMPEPQQADVGEQWMLIQSGNTALGQVDYFFDLSLESKRGDLANIALSGRISASTSGALETEEQSIKGNCAWNTRLGILEDLESTSVLKMVPAVEGMNLKVDSRATTTLTRVR